MTMNRGKQQEGYGDLRDGGDPLAQLAGHGLDDVLLSLAAAFVKIPGSEVETHIKEWLSRVAEHIGAERASLWAYSADGETVHQRYFHSTIDAEPPARDLSASHFRWITEQSLLGNVVAWLRIPEDLPAEAMEERAHLRQVGLRALLTVPVLSGSSLYIMTYSARQPRPEWAGAIVLALRLVGTMFASAIERAHAEVARLSTEARSRALLKVLPDSMFVIGPGGTYIDYHARDVADLYAPPDQFLGHPFEEVLPPNEAQMARAQYERALNHEGVVQFEFELPLRGELQQFEARLVRRDDGAVIVIVRNISKDVRARLENERLRLELAHSGRLALLGHLTASLAHELMQPITAVISNAEVAQRLMQRNRGELRAIMSDIVENSLRAAEVIERVRALLTKEPRPHERVDLNQLAREMAKIVRSELLLRSVRLVLELDPAQPQVHGDAVTLQQVMLNLLLNGAEAMAETQPDERLLILQTVVRGPRVRLSVRDYGSGVDTGDLPRLFEPFFSTKSRGIGMGLSISAEIVRAHGGRLTAERCESGGMHFHFEIPLLTS